MFTKGKLSEELIEAGSENRKYLYYVPTSLPKDKPVPLLISFHGAGSDAFYHSRLTQFHKLAEEKQFMVLYPEAKQVHSTDLQSKQWNDGRKSNPAYQTDVEDKLFIENLLDWWQKVHLIDASRIYLSGFSNGGAFSLRLASEKPGRFAGVGAVSGTMPPSLEFSTASPPPPLIFIMGDEDPVIPFTDAELRGCSSFIIKDLLDANQTIEKWLSPYGESVHLHKERLPTRSLKDRSRVDKFTYSNAQGHVIASFYTIKGGGHTWPGGPKLQLPEFGHVSQQIDASNEMWEAFRSFSSLQKQ
ncbi:alpha/beta hydrolase family esterase [Salsuginibacillus kocurii]|uniref:extracellular catalytic domain type 1 short-chain-length polyhydroxyalkanoate depolymerase n=1 Tax=Salsuginibacillus kocurii TaxID=427078 RepID=UPI0003784DAB|nr:PHB depolymerase family esterase [Salsuginibacillus kocurii]